MIKEIAFTGYPVTDIPRARKFYEETLGLKPSLEEAQWVEYDLGAATFSISTYGKPSSDGPSVAFEVEDFEGAVERVRAAGTEVVGEAITTPVCRMILIKDPDGNVLILHKRNEGHS